MKYGTLFTLQSQSIIFSIITSLTHGLSALLALIKILTIPKLSSYSCDTILDIDDCYMYLATQLQKPKHENPRGHNAERPRKSHLVFDGSQDFNDGRRP